MPLTGNGQLLVKVKNVTPRALLGAAGGGPIFEGYDTETLSLVLHQLRLTRAPDAPGEHWVIAKPHAARLAAIPQSPWDHAHQFAAETGYAHYVEPDILHEREVLKDKDFVNPHYPPQFDPQIGFAPDWHLGDGFTGFATAHKSATGKGVRIAHLDTGYSPIQCSKPRQLRVDLGYDYWDRKPDPVDPGTEGLLDQPGHGTATLALLAGGHVELLCGKYRYSGDLGGAPDAEVVPVRISPSVIHFYTTTMAKGLYHALAPSADPNHPDPAMRCDVVSISHGGLPAHSWADAVNELYENGIVIVAASGDSYRVGPLALPTHFTVYPSAFNRVLTAVGVTYTKKPYVTDETFVMQGCWGPDDVMQKAIAAFTPNVPWMKFDEATGYEMSGGGTSSSTPQVAAACALWMQAWGGKWKRDWRRVEACRLALFTGADRSNPDLGKLGRGLLSVPGALDSGLNEKILAFDMKPSPEDSVSFPLWRLISGKGPPDSDQERMYETEVAQLVLHSTNPELRKVVLLSALNVDERQRVRDMIIAEGASQALKQRLAA